MMIKKYIKYVLKHFRINKIKYKWYNSKRKDANRAIFKLVQELDINGSEDYILCDAMWDNPFQWLRFALMRKSLSKKYGNKLLGVYLKGTSKDILSSLKALDVDIVEEIPTEPKSQYIEKAKDLLKNVKNKIDLINLKFPNKFPAHLFYDGILKTERIGTIDHIFPSLVYYLAQMLQYFDIFEIIIKNYKIKAVMVSHPVNLRYITLLWCSLKMNIPSFVINYANEHITIKRLNEYKDLNMAIEFPTSKQYKNLTDSAHSKLIRRGQIYLNLLRRGQIGEFSFAKIYSSKESAYDSNEIASKIGCNNSKPNIVIMTNCWSDFPNFNGKTYFTDYVDWFNITLDAIKNINNVNWIIKPHPAEYMYHDNVDIKKIIKNKNLSGEIFFWPEGLPGNALENFAYCIITARGTAGIEYVALGMRILVASKSQYTHLGFSNFASNKEAYINALKDVLNTPLPTKQQQEDALIYIALVMTSPENTRGKYEYPHGIYSYKLWPKVSKFINQNKININKEIQMIDRWLESGEHSYNVFKGINFD